MTVLPAGSELGVLGGGQLGRMFVMAAHRLGYRVAVLADSENSPAGQLADREVVADLGDAEAVAGFAKSVAAVTFETEALTPAVLAAAAEVGCVSPAAHVLEITGDRLRQRRFLDALGIPVSPHAIITDGPDVDRVAALPLFPAFVKRAREGYDGRGQLELCSPDGLRQAWEELGGPPALVEKAVDVAVEFSVIVVRNRSGQVAVYEPIRNKHRLGVLRSSSCPAALPVTVESHARAIATQIAEKLALEGVLCVEFFLDAAGAVLVNELAARPHNSGHLTIQAFESSQFEQQVRVLAGLPLGGTRLVHPAAMVNLFGGVPGAEAAEELGSGAVLYRYGKSPRPGRKAGHITAVAETAEAALSTALALAARFELADTPARACETMPEIRA